MLAVTNSGALIGVQAQAINIKVNSGERGELKYILVGLPDSAVKESQDRVLSALDNCGFQAPNTKTTINLAPGDLKKEGPSYDLPIVYYAQASKVDHIEMNLGFDYKNTFIIRFSEDLDEFYKK